MSGRRILVTGPESSGTNYTAALIKAGGGDVLQRSQPHGELWVDLRAMLEYPASGYDAPIPPFDRIVIVVRGMLAHEGSLVRRNIEETPAFARERRRAALERVAPILGDPRTLLITYESLAYRDERAHLLDLLGLDPAGADHEDAEYRYRNGQYYAG